MLFLLILLAGDTLRFTNPRVIEDSSTALFAQKTRADGGIGRFDFQGSKGVFIVLQGLTLDLSQSLDLSLHDKISKSMFLNARLKDDYTYYGRDYYSKSLEDVNEIYLNVEDSRGFGVNLGRFYYEGRKLLGFEGVYKDFRVVYGSTEQTRKRKIIEYRDFCNGPYFVDYGYLIVPGSVRVLLNGSPLERSSYSFDYSSGALYFNNVEVFPGDVIYVEYSTYSSSPSLFTAINARYRNVTFNFEKLSSSKGFYSGFPAEILEYFEENGDSCASQPYHGGVRTVKGDYLLQDSIYIFAGQGKGEYQVYFKFVGEGKGSYVFDNSLGGYKFVGEGNGLYEPELDLSPPSLYSVGEVVYDGIFRLSGRLSYKDLNILSRKDDDDNIGYDLEFSRDFYTDFANFHVRWRNRSYSFSTIDEEVDPFWGIKGERFVNQLDLSFDLKKIGTFLNASSRFVEGKRFYQAFLKSQMGPFYAQGLLSVDDSTIFRMFAGINFKKFPSFNILISGRGNLRAFLSDSIRGFNYLIGANFEGEKKSTTWFSKAGFKYAEDEGEVSADLFYFPEYYSSILYRFSGVSKLADGLSINGAVNLITTFLPLQEERYYRTPMGMYNYDERTGFFVPDVNGGYDRELVSLGVFDTTLQKSYSFGAEFNYSFSGSLLFERACSNFSDNSLITANLQKNQFELNWKRLRKDLSNVLNGHRTENTEFKLKFPLLKAIFLNFRYRNYLEEPIHYSIWSGYFTFASRWITLNAGMDYTYFESNHFPGVYLEGTVYKTSDKVKIAGSFYVNFPLNAAVTLPLSVPTSKRYGVNLSLKKPYRSGEFFVEGFYSRSLATTSKIRTGYNFLF